MAIKKYYAAKDNTITNAYKSNLITRGEESNMGGADILEAFVIHGQTTASVTTSPSAANASGAEQCRFIIQFPISTITSDMASGVLPADTGSIKFYLNLYNAPHGNTAPRDFSLDVYMLSETWTEGRGLDMENYTDLGASSWLSSAAGTTWTQAGGTYLAPAETKKTFTFETGLENMSLDVSDQVYKWLDAVGGEANYGFLVKFPDSVVSGSETMYTKKFFSRTSEFFHYRPTLEARWDSTRKDHRGSFFVSSSVASADNNLNTLYLYNIVRGQLQNIPGLSNETLTVDIYSGSAAPSGGALSLVKPGGTADTSVTAGILRENGATITGVYTASFASTSALDTVFDVWHTGSGGSRVDFYTASYEPKTFGTIDGLYREEYITSITNLEDSYTQGQTPNLRVFARKKNWNPNIYTVATAETLPDIIEDSYYRIHRVVDDLEVIPFGTGSANNYFSRLSYDVSGNYFELDTSYLEPGYAYGITFAYYLQGEYVEQPEVFKFKIKEEDK
tara:strand:+ start:15836 stop:17353 length:1518 start_codon:yes stop_codon:yes gene_type:complete